jgi:hypothetical protein
MPMIVDLAAPQITQPTRVVSPDGWFAAIVDPLWAGVALSVNYSAPADTAVNWVTNPSTETNTTGQLTYDPATAGVTASRVAGAARFGSYRASVTFGGSGSVLGGYQYALARSFTAGETVTVSAYVNLPVTATEAYILLRNSATGAVRTLAVSVPAAGAYQRVVGTVTLAAGESFNRCGVAFRMPAGTVWAIDGAMLELGDTAHPYVDGDQPGCTWDGAAHASTSRRVASSLPYADVLKVRITRTDPGAVPVPVRSGETAWAVEGVGTAYDGEAPLGVGVVYTATAIYADGSTGPSSSLAVTVPAPEPGDDRDLWIKSLDEPALSMRAMLVDWSGATAAGRQDSADVAGSPYRAVAYDEHAAESVQIVVDVAPEDVDRMRALLRSGVLLAQARPAYLFPDSFHVPGDITGPTPTGKLGSTEGYRFGWTIDPVERPDATGQPMRLPGWSWDVVADRFATWDALAASYPSWASLSTNGVT